jgi:hypothetical protein
LLWFLSLYSKGFLVKVLTYTIICSSIVLRSTFTIHKKYRKTKTKMKAVTLVLFSFILSFCCQAQQATVSTFNNRSVHYGWNGTDFREEDLHGFLSENFSKVQKLQLQEGLDKKGIKAELLWKLSGPLSEVTKITKDNPSSWFWDQAAPDAFTVVFKPDGAGIIRLFQKGSCVAQFRCHTSNKRNAEKYNQLEEKVNKPYSITEKKIRHVSTEKGLEGSVLKQALYSGVDGKWFHEGEYDVSHGCVRVSKPAMTEFYSRVPVGTPFFVRWE